MEMGQQVDRDLHLSATLCDARGGRPQDAIEITILLGVVASRRQPSQTKDEWQALHPVAKQLTQLQA